MKKNKISSTTQSVYEKIKNLNFTAKRAVTLFSFLVILIIAIAFLGFLSNFNTRANKITVTGSAQKDIVSDLIVWSGYFSATSMNLKDAYSKLRSDMTKIKAFLKSKEVPENEIVFESIDMHKKFRRVKEADIEIDVFDGYYLSQNIKIESKEVDKIEKISREITELIEQGVELSSNSPEYFYTDIAQLKKIMIGLAAADAYSRTLQVVKNSNAGLGKLRNAKVGVFQIIGQNSSETFSSGGTFNTHSKNKTISINVNLEYGIK